MVATMVYSSTWPFCKCSKWLQPWVTVRPEHFVNFQNGRTHGLELRLAVLYIFRMVAAMGYSCTWPFCKFSEWSPPWFTFVPDHFVRFQNGRCRGLQSDLTILHVFRMVAPMGYSWAWPFWNFSKWSRVCALVGPRHRGGGTTRGCS